MKHAILEIPDGIHRAALIGLRETRAAIVHAMQDWKTPNKVYAYLKRELDKNTKAFAALGITEK